MGKIVAIGGGRYSDGEIINIFEKIVSLADKRNPKVLFLPTAGYDDINGDEDIQRSFEKYGCQYDILYLTDEKRTVDDIHSVILGADIIYVGGDELLFEQAPLGHDDRGPAQAGDFRDGPDRDFHRSFASPPEAVDDRKEFLLGAVEPQVLPHKLVYGRERHHRYEGLRILSRSEHR